MKSGHIQFHLLNPLVYWGSIRNDVLPTSSNSKGRIPDQEKDQSLDTVKTVFLRNPLAIMEMHRICVVLLWSNE